MKKEIALILASVLTTFIFTGCNLDISQLQNKGTEVSDDVSDDESQDDYILNSDKEYITENDLSKLSEEGVRYALEEIYARHGKIFNDPNLSDYFRDKDWYKQDPLFDESSLSNLELDNVNFINKYIKENYETTTETTTEAPVRIVNPNNTSTNNYYNYNYNYDYYDDYQIIPDSSSRKLTRSELSGYSLETLGYIRNEIYARHGYVFQKDKYKEYFGSKSWYVPNYSFNSNDLNSIEKYNVQLIKEMEG